MVSTRFARHLGRLGPDAGLVGLKLAVSAWTLHTGFTHVSDDDYARVTIAQAFAHAPRFDPSGTSWLPFPFWLNGVAMMLLGRTLLVAQVVAVASSVLGAILVRRSLVGAGVSPGAAWVGVALAMSAPWSAWLGVATVPEALTACLIATAALSMKHRAARLPAAGGLLVACLSRYEAWPVALVFAGDCLWLAWREERGTEGSSAARVRPSLRAFAAAALALLGPALWILWNAHAHGDPLHFVARVAAYRLRMAGGTGETRSLMLYPEAGLRAGPGALALLGLGALALWENRALKERWAWPSVAMLALGAFLVYGDLRDGAPTHHPERALVAFFWLATAFGVDGAWSLATRLVWGHPKREAWLVAVVTAVAVAWGLVWPTSLANHPAKSASEDRSSQIAMGEDLAARSVPHVTLTPCGYEHFALIAGYGAPERATALAQATGSSGPCPLVVER